MNERKRDQKRRDKKGRILRNGESQRADGRYAFVYTDCYGKQKFLYSWKLEPTDSLPVGRRPCQSLREKEKIVLREIEDGITPYGGNLTVLELVKKYIRQKTGVRHNTQANYNFVINIIAKEDFGQKRIDTIKLSDAKEWLIKLQADGRGYSSIHSIRGVVRPAFQMAVDDELLRKNPFEFQLSTVVVNDSVTREAITRKQERALLEFVKNDKHFSRYYEGIYILFKTGLRISEFVGLQKSDIDFESGTIRVDHQLQKLYHGFLYLDKNDMPMVALHWEKYFEHIITKYNSIYKEELPKVTPHVCRHTYCSNMVKSGMNPKTLQYLMGHADIGVTLNTYTHVGLDDVKNEIDRVTALSCVEA